MLKRKVLITLLLCFLPTVILAQDNAELERATITKAIEDSIGWALTKDFDRLFEVLAHDENFFIFHPDSKSTVVGWNKFKELSKFYEDPRFKATHFEVKDLRLNLSRSGDVAWYSCFLDDCGEWEGKPIAWENARWTGVLEKRDGKWVIVQMHFSFPNDLKQEN